MTDEDDKKPQLVLEVKDGEVPDRKNLKLFRGTFLDAAGDNFLGSGLSFGEWSRTGDILRYDRWHGAQTIEERRRRMGFIIKLCVEQDRLVTEHVQATGLSQALIEEVIAGDWIEVKCWIEQLTFDVGRDEYCDIQAARFKRFREIAQEAYDTRPQVYCPVCIRPAPKDKIKAHPDGRHVCPWCDIVHDDAGKWEDKNKAHLTAVDPDQD